MWAFFVMNVMGFVTYHLYPAAPPWYYHSHGCSVDVLAHASEGPNLARVDQLLGVHYFAGMYGRSSDVFGAIPSLHVAYPLLICIEVWRHVRWPLRLAGVGFFLLMCFSAVYLDHHWVIDVVIGIGYCLVAAGAMRAVQRWRPAATNRPNDIESTPVSHPLV
jgi:membrane-associated phospholipid phosphatase